jgi:hypothetical protein
MEPTLIHRLKRHLTGIVGHVAFATPLLVSVGCEGGLVGVDDGASQVQVAPGDFSLVVCPPPLTANQAFVAGIFSTPNECGPGKQAVACSATTLAGAATTIYTCTPAVTNPFTNISLPAVNHVAASGVTNFGWGVSHIDHGDWIDFGVVDFKQGAANLQFVVQLATPHFGDKIQLRTGSAQGPVVATITTTQSGPNWSTVAEQSASLTTSLTGPQHLFVTFDGQESLQLCQSSCWAQQLPSCGAALSRGCGHGIANLFNVAIRTP